MKTNRILRVFDILLVVMLLLLFMPASPVLAADVNLKTPAVGTGSNTRNDTTEGVVATADVNSSVDGGDKVLVVASVSASEEDKSMTGSFWLTNADGSEESQVFIRELTDSKATDYGLISLAHVFTADDTNDAFSVKHQTDNAPMTSFASVVALPLESTAGSEMPYGAKVYNTADAPPNGSWEEVGTGSGATCRTGDVVLPVASHIYVMASIECQSTNAATSVGQWKLEYSTDGFSTAGVATGNTISRSMNGNNDRGNITLLSLIESADAGTYQFRVMHQANSTNALTNKVNLVAVALQVNSHHLQAWSVQQPSDTTTGTGSFENVDGATITFTPDVSSANLFVHSQFQIAGTVASVSTYQMTTSTPTYDTLDMYRSISGSSDTGSGSALGLTSITNTECTLNLQHQITTGTLTTSNIDMLAFVTGYDEATPPLPEWPTIGLVLVGLAVIGTVYWWRTRNRTVTQSVRSG